jgi:serine/threonine-protein kinase
MYFGNLFGSVLPNPFNISMPYCRFKIYNPRRSVCYYAQKLLNEGGFGKVWAGTTSLGQGVAIKIFKPSSNADRDFSCWFREQQLCLQCYGHPNIVMSLDQFVTQNGYMVLVMELATGNLESVISGGRPARPAFVRSVGLQILNALHYIHNTVGAIHRDVTLRNILLFKNGIVKLSDFSIAKENVSAYEIARTFVGTPAFIPPELYINQFTTYQSDIYQLGLVMLSLLIGKCPVPLNVGLETARKLVVDGVPRITAERLVCNQGDLASVISKMLPRHLQYRYKSAAQVHQDLLQVP